jgi:murein L,D-transpeptidase YafK
MKYIHWLLGIGLLLGIFLCTTSLLPDNGFLTNQKKYSRVREAIQEKDSLLLELLSRNNLIKNQLHVVFIAFKKEQKLEVWAKNKGENSYKLLQKYAICASSGKPGPKLKQGDLQVPEGIYYIDRFNPASSYHLSLGINYPNQVDKLRSKGLNPGGDIFIHGKCVTIGCLPMTDDKIKELYLFAIYSKAAGQNKIPVYIFPFNMKNYNNSNQNESSSWFEFWNSLKLGFDNWELKKQELNYTPTSSGNYLFK